MFKRTGFLLGLGFLTSAVYGAESLFYLESQGIAGYSSQSGRAIYYSMDPNDPMQKPSVGFDYLQRFSSDSGDWGTAGLQFRLAYNDPNKVEPQIYNAYFKEKFSWADVWVGHDRPAFGLSSFLDTHGTVLQTLDMEGFGFDRDWGAGFYKTYEDGDIAFSLTTGSWMPLIVGNNYLADARFSLGVLERDNFSAGLSLSRGNVLNIMGYQQMGGPLIQQELAGVDASFNWLNYEFKFEAVGGDKSGQFTSGTLFRAGVNLLEENKLKLEVQPVYLINTDQSTDLKIYSGVTLVLNEYLSVRAMDIYDTQGNFNNIVGQIYLYRRLFL
jgi:hypothetical protein